MKYRYMYTHTQVTKFTDGVSYLGRQLETDIVNVQCDKFTYKMSFARLKRKSSTASSVRTRDFVCLSDAKKHKQPSHQDP